MSDDTTIKGLSELQRFLDELPAKIERNIMRGAMRAGAKDVLLPAVRQNIRSVSGELADSLTAGATARGGTVTGYVRTRHYRRLWVEYGTRPHYIQVKGAGRRNYSELGVSVRTLNRMVERGSLVIGGQFVGSSVAHPGAQKKPFLRPALDTRGADAVVAVGEYVKKRLADKHGLDTADISIEAEE